MPVLLFSRQNELDLVRGLASKLRSDGGEVRCYLEEDDYDLRSIGCKIAVGDLDDQVNIEAALTGVHTFIPIFADPVTISSQLELDGLLKVADAASESAAESSVGQTIVPLVGLAESHGEFGDVYRRIEELFVTRTKPVFLLRTGLLWGPDRPLEMQAEQAQGVASKVSVLEVEEWVRAVAAADDLENVHGVWELGGRSLSNVHPSSELHPWMRHLFEVGFNLGSSAEEILPVRRP